MNIEKHVGSLNLFNLVVTTALTILPSFKKIIATLPLKN